MGRERKVSGAEQDPQVRAEFGLQLRLLRVQSGKTQSEWAEAVKIDASAISQLETGKRHQILTRDVIIDYGQKWGLSWEDRTTLLLSGRYIPELPTGFGTPLDRILLRGAVKELFEGSQDYPFCDQLRRRCIELYEFAS